MHARRFTGYQNANFVKISVSDPSALGLRFLKGSHMFFPVAPRRPPQPSVSPRPGVRMWSSRRWRVSRWASPFLLLSPEHVRANSPVEFAHDYLYPIPEAHDTISFGLDEVLLTAASDSENFGPALANAFLPSGQEAWPTNSSLLRARGHALPRHWEALLDWPDEPRKSQAGRVDIEPSDSSPDLGSVWQSGSGPLCFTGVVPMPTLVLSKFPSNSGHRCVCASVAEHETVPISASQADSSSPMQGEGERYPSPTHCPILALPDVVLRAGSSSVSAPLGDSDQARPALSASGQNLASSAGDLEAVGMAHTGSRALISNLPFEVQETIASARASATRKLYSSKWGVFESWCLARLTALSVQYWSFWRRNWRSSGSPFWVPIVSSRTDPDS